MNTELEKILTDKVQGTSPADLRDLRLSKNDTELILFSAVQESMSTGRPLPEVLGVWISPGLISKAVKIANRLYDEWDAQTLKNAREKFLQ